MIKAWSLSTRFFTLDFVGAISIACYTTTFELKRDFMMM